MFNLIANIRVNEMKDNVLYFVVNNKNKTEVITGKQAKQKKAMKLLGIWTDGAFWNEERGQLQVMLKD